MGREVYYFIHRDRIESEKRMQKELALRYANSRKCGSNPF